MIKNCLFFGSDNISTCTLKALLNKSKPQSLKICAVCPPLAKPRTPLADFHYLLEESNIDIEYAFPKSSRDEKAIHW